MDEGFESEKLLKTVKINHDALAHRHRNRGVSTPLPLLFLHVRISEKPSPPPLHTHTPTHSLFQFASDAAVAYSKIWLVTSDCLQYSLLFYKILTHTNPKKYHYLNMRHQIYYAVKNKTLINFSACRSFSLLRCDIISREGIKFINNEVVFIYVMILHHCTTLICNIRRNLFLVNILFCVLASVRHS